MADDAGPAAKVAGGSGKAKESLSQFVARVLDQLSLSAWLPAAALVLGLDYVFQSGAMLDAEGSKPRSARLGRRNRRGGDV
jgi:hypothetical protein